MKKCYAVYEENLEYDEAFQKCAQILGTLAEPVNQMEIDAIQSEIQSKDNLHFIGVLNKTAEHCVAIDSKTGNWVLQNCSQKLPFICQTRASCKYKSKNFKFTNPSQL